MKNTSWLKNKDALFGYINVGGDWVWIRIKNKAVAPLKITKRRHRAIKLVHQENTELNLLQQTIKLQEKLSRKKAPIKGAIYFL